MIPAAKLGQLVLKCATVALALFGGGGGGVGATPPPALEAKDGVLQTVGGGAAAEIKGISWFGFNVQSGMLDGLWAGIDLATTTAQLKLLGFNTLRIPFDFSLLKNKATDYRWPNCTRRDLLRNTLDPSTASSLTKKLLPSSSSQQLVLPARPALVPPGMCNSYLPQGGSNTVEDALVWLVPFLVSQGFYVVLNHHSLVSGSKIELNPSEFASAWGNFWWRIASHPNFDSQLKGRVFVDIANELDHLQMKWSAQQHMVGATDVYLRVMDRLHAITPQGMLYFVEGTGQTNYGLCWGSGFVTDRDIVRKHNIDDASPFFAKLLSKPYKHQVVISPHEYGPHVRKSTLTGNELTQRLNASHGYLATKGFCGSYNNNNNNKATAGCVRFPVVVGEFGANMQLQADVQFLVELGAWLRRKQGPANSNNWILWAVNANCGDTGGLLDRTLWQDFNWDKIRHLVQHFGLRPWWWKS